jgi:hypothetical protein
MVGLMAPDIEWISVVDSNVQDRGSKEVMRKVFVPLMQKRETFSPAPSEFLVDGSTVVSLGRFACVHRATHKRDDLVYAHVWDIRTGQSDAIVNTSIPWRSNKSDTPSAASVPS